MNNIPQPIIGDNLYLLIAPEKDAKNQVMKLSQAEGWQMSSIQGEKFPDTNGFFETLKDTFQLSDYCSYGWDSFWEGISEDLNVLMPAKGYAIYISHADQLLKDDDFNFNTFVQVLKDASETWAKKNTPFKVFFQAEPENADLARQRLLEADEKATHPVKQKSFLKSHRFPVLIATLMLIVFNLPAIVSNYLGQDKMTIEGATFVSYENKEHGFKFFYPENWILAQPPLDAILVFLVTKTKVPAQRGFFMVNIEKLADTHQSLASYSSENIQNLKDNFPDITLLESRDILFSGKPAHEIIQTATSNNHLIKSRQILYLRDGKAYAISYSAGVEFYDDYEPIAKQMIQTFKIL